MRWRRLIGVILIAGMCLLTVGCGSGGSESDEGSQPGGNQQSDQKKRGGILRLADEPPGSPFGVPWEIVSTGIIAGVPALEPLLGMGWEGTIDPKLAERWEADPANKAITLYLRRNVKFHDGTDFNAEAARYNLEKAIEAKRIPHVESVEIVDSHTVRLKLTQWYNTVFLYLSGSQAPMVSPTAIEENGLEWARYHPVGTGPFVFESYQRDQNVIYKRFENYWDEGKPYLDGIEIHFIRDPQTRKAAFLGGEIDAFGAEDRQLIAEMVGAGYPTVQGKSGSSLTVLVPDSANASSPLADKRVRQAIAHAIDRQALADARGFGVDKPMEQLAVPGSSAYLEGFEGFPYDPERAKQLLAGAGYADGFSTKLIAPQYIDRDLVVAIQEFLDEVGIRAEIEMPEATRFLEYRTKGWNGMLVERLGSFPSYVHFMGFYFSKNDSPSRFASLKRPDGLEQLYQEAMSAPSEDIDMGRRLHQMVLDDVTHIPILTGSRVYIFQDYVKDTHHLQWSAWPWWSPGEAWLDR